MDHRLAGDGGAGDERALSGRGMIVDAEGSAVVARAGPWTQYLQIHGKPVAKMAYARNSKIVRTYYNRYI